MPISPGSHEIAVGESRLDRSQRKFCNRLVTGDRRTADQSLRKPLEAFRRQVGVASGVLDVLVPEIVLTTIIDFELSGDIGLMANRRQSRRLVTDFEAFAVYVPLFLPSNTAHALLL